MFKQVVREMRYNDTLRPLWWNVFLLLRRASYRYTAATPPLPSVYTMDEMDVDEPSPTEAVTTSPSSFGTSLPERTGDDDHGDNCSSAANHSGDDDKNSNNCNLVALTLIDAVPCNLKNGAWFLRSRIRADVSREHLRLFLYCYGFLLYDKRDKLALFRANTSDTRVHEVAAMLDECRTLGDFKNGIREQLRVVNDLLADPVLAATTDELHSRVLDVARQSLEHIFEFVRDTDHLRRSVNANEYSIAHVFRPDERATRAIFDAWHDAENCDLDRCVSVIFRDAVVSTGMLTHSTMLFVIRACLVLTFLVTNFMRNDAVVTIDQPQSQKQQSTSAEDTATSTLTDDFWTQFGGLTVDKFIATTMVAMTRMFVDSCIAWPLRIRDESSISVAKFRSKLIAKMVASSTNVTGGASARALQWLRVMKRPIPPTGHSTTSSLATDGGKRLYVRFEALLDLFDRMSATVSGETTTLATAGATMDKAANAVTGNSGGGGVIKCTDRQLARQWNEYENDFTICTDALTESQRENGNLLGMSVERFVVGTDTTFRGRDDDRLLLAAVNECNNDEDEVDSLNGDLARMYLFAVLSLARYAPVKIYGTDYTSSDAPVEAGSKDGETPADCDELLTVLLVHIASHLFRSRVTMRQTRELFDYVLSVWRTHRGLVTLEQLSQILFTLYRLFQL